MNLAMFTYVHLNPLALIDPDGNSPYQQGYNANDVRGGFIFNSNTGAWESRVYHQDNYDPSTFSALLSGTVGAGAAAILAPEVIAACAGTPACAASAMSFGIIQDLNSAADGVPGGGVPNRGVADLLADPKFQRSLKDVDCVDCDDIARQLYKASGEQGKILDLTVPGGSIKVKEFGELEDFVDHRVFSDGKNIVDPRFSNNPIPINQYMDELRNLNPNLEIKFGNQRCNAIEEECVRDLKVTSELELMQKKINSKELSPKKGYRRDVAVYELVCYVNNITGCYLSDNLEPIRIFIDRARAFIEDNEQDEINRSYFELVLKYLGLMEEYLDDQGK